MQDNDRASRRRAARSAAPETAAEDVARSEVAAPVSRVASAQADLGNAMVQGALLGGEGLLGASIVADVALGAAGFGGAPAGAPAPGSRSAILRHGVADDGVDYSSPALTQLRQGGGDPLPTAVRERMESAFGHDFSGVRVHVGSQAGAASEALQAHAFALGSHIFFGPGEWAPGTPSGDRLIAHELTHVVQADQGRLPSGGGVSDPTDGYEREAYQNEDRILNALSRGPADASTASGEGAIEADLGAVASADTPALGGPAAPPSGGGAPVGGPPAGGAPAGGDAPAASGVAMRDARGAGAASFGQAKQWIEQSTGQALPQAVADRMAAALGHDFGHVAIHTDAAAAKAADALHAHAFALGSHVFFGSGEYQPGSAAGAERLAHELTHVVQHDQGQLPTSGDLDVSSPSDAAEREAYQSAAQAVDAMSAGPSVDASISAPGAEASVGSVAPVESAPTASAGPVVAQGVVHRDNKPGGNTPKPATTTGGDFERGSVVEINGGGIGIVTAKGEGDALEVRTIGQEGSQSRTAGDLAAYSGLESLELGIEPGKACFGIVGEGAVRCLVVAVKETEETTPTGSQVTKRVVAFAINGDKVNLDGKASVVSMTEAMPTKPTYEVEAEVYGKYTEKEWRRGKVTAAVRPTGDAVVAGGGENAPDGWQYTVQFERAEGAIETKTYLSDKLHKADPLTTPGPTTKGKPQETNPPKTNANPGAGPNDTVPGPTQTSTPGAPLQTGAPTGTPASTPVTVNTNANFTPATVTPVDNVPMPTATVTPVVAPAPTLEPGQAKHIENQTGVPVQKNLSDINQTLNTLTTDTAKNLQSTIDTANSSTGNADAIIASANNQFQTTAATTQNQLVTAATNASTNVDQVASTTVAQVNSTSATALSTIDTTATTATAALSDKEKAMRAAITANKEKYTAAFDAAIRAKRTELETKLNGAITTIETEATTQEAKAKADSKKAGSGGAEAAADAVAGQLAEVSVKKKYVKAMRALAKETLERVKQLEGDPMKILSGKLTAPTLDDLWPAKGHYEKHVQEQKDKKKLQIDAAKKKFENVTTAKATEIKATTTQVQTQTNTAITNANTALTKTTTDVTKQNADQNKVVTSDLALQNQKTTDQLNNTVQQTQGTPLAPVWQAYVLQYQTEQAAKANLVKNALTQGSNDKAVATQTAVTNAQNQLQTQVNTVNQTLATDTQNFSAAVTTNASSTVTQATNATTQMTSTGANIATTAQTQQDQALKDLDADAQAYITNTVNTTIGDYALKADETFNQLANKMQDDLKGAGEKGKKAEQADRDKRADGCRAAAEYTWGTDEELYMKSVSGVTPVQGYALQNEYQKQYSEGLRWRIDDETSGSLKTSLLAWTVGNEVAAVEAAMDYAANSFWGPDVATQEAALRGLSDEGRKKLQGNEQFEKNRQKMLFRCQADRWFPDQNDTDSLKVLSDMSQTKEQAELVADAIKLEDCFNRLTGTDEKGAFELLGKRDQEGNAKLAEAYAKYTYERENQGKKWDDLSADEKKKLTDNRMKGDIDGDMDGYEEDRAMALVAGNKGLARSAQLKQSAWGLNDDEEALAAMDNANLNGGETWMDQVDAYQEQANFLQGNADYANGKDIDAKYIENANSMDAKKTALNNFQTNKATTKTWLNTEFGGSGGVSGDEDNDSILNRMLNDKLETGEAKESDLMAYGVDTTGTREKYVTQALQQIAGEPDVNLRLQKLEDLGGYCANFIGQNNDVDMIQAKQNAAKGMGRLPGYITKDIQTKHPNLYGAIKNIMIVLDYESDGGEQFDFELLVAKAAVRDNNVLDKWEYAVQMYANQGVGNLDKYRNDPEVLAFQSSNTTKIVDAESSYQETDSDKSKLHEGIGDEHEKLLAAHLLNVEKFKNAGAGVWWEKDTGWLKLGEDGQPTQEATTKWEEFCRLIDRVDRATKDVERNNDNLVSIISTVVAVVAGVLITIVSFGSATWAAAGLISAAITLTAGAITMTAKYMIKGDRYGEEEFLTDLASTVADAVLNVVTLGAGKLKGLASVVDDWVKAGGSTILRVFMGEAAKAIPGELKTILFSEDFWRGEKWDKLALDAILNLTKAGVGGVLSDKAKIGMGVKDATKIVDQTIGAAIDNMSKLLTDPSKWDDNFGWQVLKALAEAGVAGTLAKGVYTNMASRLAAKPTLTDGEWAKIKGLPEDVRVQMLKGLPDHHIAALTAKAQADSATYGSMLTESGRTLPPATTTPTTTTTTTPDPNTDQSVDPNQNTVSDADQSKNNNTDETKDQNPVVDPDANKVKTDADPTKNTEGDGTQNKTTTNGSENGGTDNKTTNHQDPVLLDVSKLPPTTHDATLQKSLSEAADPVVKRDTMKAATEQDKALLQHLDTQPDSVKATDSWKTLRDETSERYTKRLDELTTLTNQAHDYQKGLIDGTNTSTQTKTDADTNNTPGDDTKTPPPEKKTTLQLLNQGSQEELEALPGIGTEKAKKIIADREANGPFHAIGDIERVNGVSVKTVEKVQGAADYDMLTVLNKGTKEELMQLPGIGPDKADQILELRTKKAAENPGEPAFTSVNQLGGSKGKPGILESKVAGNLQAKQKMACVDGDPTPGIEGLKNKFKSDVEAALNADPEANQYEIMQKVVKNEDGLSSTTYKLQGPEIPKSVLANYKGLTRVVGIKSIYERFMSTDTHTMLKDAHGINDADAFIAKVKSDPNFFQKSWIDASKTIGGQNDVAWWTPVKTDGSTTYAEFMKDRALNSEYYEGGCVEFVIKSDAASTSKFKRPTAFDGMLFGEYALPDKSSAFGMTAGGQEEAVAPPIPVSEASEVKVYLQ